MRKITVQNILDFVYCNAYVLLWGALFYSATIWLYLQGMNQVWEILTLTISPLVLAGLIERAGSLRTPRYWLEEDEADAVVSTYCKKHGIKFQTKKMGIYPERFRYGFFYLEDMLQVKLAI